jgi:hypothetical protein
MNNFISIGQMKMSLYSLSNPEFFASQLAVIP